MSETGHDVDDSKQSNDQTAIENSVEKPPANSKAPVATNIRVIARFRPLFAVETEGLDTTKSISYVGTQTVALYQGSSTFDTFTFDRVFDTQSTQDQLFECVGMPICQEVVSGYNGTVFAYGQTGSGKTHTMMGEDLYEQEQRGIVPRCATFIFDWVDKQTTDSEFTIRISMIEIYKEQIHDLLNPEEDNLQIKQDSNRGIYVKDLTEYCVVNEDELLEIISIGESVRTVAATKMNKQSSRSHQIVMVEIVEKMESGSEKKGRLNLVDLAGSEKIAHTGVTGKNLEEAKKINLSLSCLGNVINSLVKKADHIPYRDSKLTRLLQESLGGNYKTTLIVAASPNPNHFEDTINTLKFAQRAKTIKNKAKLNLMRSPAEYMRIINKLKEEVKRLKAEMSNMKNGQLDLPSLNRWDTCPEIFDKPRSQSVVATSPKVLQSPPLPVTSPKSDAAVLNRISLRNPHLQPILESEGNSLSPVQRSIELYDHSFNLSAFLTSEGDLDWTKAVENVVSTVDYEELKKKIEKLENQLWEKDEEICNLKEKLENQKRQTEKKATKLHKFVEDYKHYADRMTSHALADHLKGENESLNKQIQILKHTMRLTNFKYRNLIFKAKDAGIQLEECEFETAETDEVMDLEKYLEDATVDDDIAAKYVNIPLNIENIFEQSQYAGQIREIVDHENIEKDTAIYHLKNQLMQSCLINYEIRRTLTQIECKHYLTQSRRKLLEKRTVEQQKSIAALEKLLDQLHSSLTHAMNQPASTPSFTPAPTSPIPEIKISGPTLQLPGTASTPGKQCLTPSFFDSHGPRVIRRWSTRMPKRVSGFPSHFPSQVTTPMTESRQSPKYLTPEKGIRMNFTQASQAFQNETFGRKSSADYQISHTRRESDASHDPYENIRSRAVAVDLHKVQAEITIQRLYNEELLRQNELFKNEIEVMSKTVTEVERKMQEYHIRHSDYWQNLFSDYKQNCEFQLARKQSEIENLEETLVKWVREYKIIQRKINSRHKTSSPMNSTFSEQISKLPKLITRQSFQPSVNFMFAPRSSTTALIGRGDRSPPAMDEDF